MIYFTADLHFSHQLMVTERGFTSKKDHDECLIDNWNSTIKHKDKVFFLGDFSFAPKDKTQELFNTLNGQIHFIKGNHDKHIPEGCVWVKDVYQLKYNKQKIWLSHYCHQSWPSSHYGSFHCFAHSHGKIKKDVDKFRIDVGVDCWKLKPVSIDEIFGLFKHYNMLQLMARAVN